jgi:WASH complex subunit 7
MSLYHTYLKRNQEPFEIFSGCFIDIPRYIIQYLNEVFYNMNALNMNDWSVYQQMKKLALVKYNLTLKPFDLIVSNDNDDGDLLCIVKKIITFISEYKYDFYMETFSEETKLNKQSINVININTIVKSFDVNGIGIVNSIVNKLFQVIGAKIEEILNIMLDDYIKSILMQEEKEWNTLKTNVNNIYPLSSAEGFYIKNMNFLDELLRITTELGNIMGVVRTIMSSIKEYAMKHLQFISNKDNINKKYIAESDNINIQNLFNDCNNNLRNEINDLENAMKVNYLNVIIDSLIQGNDNLFGEKSIVGKDMRLFILCVPALTYAHLKQLINTQDELIKSTKIHIWKFQEVV